MYDQDGNGWIDLTEMTRIVKSIYSMMGPDQVRGWATDLKFVKKNLHDPICGQKNFTH